MSREFTITPPETVQGLDVFDRQLKDMVLVDAFSRNARFFDVKVENPTDEICLGLMKGVFMIGVSKNLNFEAAKLSAIIRSAKEKLVGVPGAEELDDAPMADFILKTFLELTQGVDDDKAAFWGSIDEVATWMMQTTPENLEEYVSSTESD